MMEKRNQEGGHVKEDVKIDGNKNIKKEMKEGFLRMEGSLLFLLWSVCVCLAVFWGFGTWYLYDESVLGMDEVSFEEYKSQNGLSYLEKLGSDVNAYNNDLRIYADAGKSLMEDGSVNALSENVAIAIAKYLVGSYERNMDVDELHAFAENQGIEYAIFLAGGRRLCGNLPTSMEKRAWICRCFFYDKLSGYYNERYFVKVWASDSDGMAYFDTMSFRLIQIWLSKRNTAIARAIFWIGISVALFGILTVMAVRIGRRKQSILSYVPMEISIGACCLFTYYGLREVAARLQAINQIEEDVTTALFLYGILAFVLFTYLHTVSRWQDKEWWRHTVAYGLVCGCRSLIRDWKETVLGLSVSVKFFLVIMGISLLEGVMLFILYFLHTNPYAVLGIWGLEKMILIPYLMKYMISFSVFGKAAEEIAGGNAKYRVDQKDLPKLFHKMADDFNDMAGGISKAVEQKMKSEHLRTELITNVSHDIKTPLTSIINFSDLICQEKTDNEKITEYAEHLNHQASRLKKLIEDLMEVSKASTGNLEVHLMPCDIKVLMEQCQGEFEPRLREKGLELVVRQKEENASILADGHMTWRIFENLMNNVCKYAMSGTRVYLSAERVEDRVRIILKNVSQYALDVPPQELMERFVRGDHSRHTEGHGLGLAIVGSLVELQNGKITLITDGDLFKVCLEFPVYMENWEQDGE